MHSITPGNNTRTHYDNLQQNFTSTFHLITILPIKNNLLIQSDNVRCYV
ncbi:hypothetical protein ymoll0001_22370 [Yersinia mollaretii ATCC 43969]|uniref:Uncharacterized protein n=1 Tax=Yersinia mollaretii (strain ATCC 43969 / DSM 18520 / CIP 103324 / CNY 7263 / WAIP 204) TaxID=349967 RepID=A0ABP2EGN9_YERMW|nr:hypothetical protein ymoll0001_22370 [Yersinia mollaretii ATCC 43969]